MSYLLDTNICITLLKGQDKQLTEKIHSLSPADLSLCSVVKGELLYGARKSQKVEANLNNGVLKINISKREEAKPRRIEVQVG